MESMYFQDLHLERLRIKAKREIGEVDEEIPKRVEELKRVIENEKDKKLEMHPSTYNDFYLKCLRAKKYDVELAAKLYKKFCYLRASVMNILPKLLPSCHAVLYANRMCSILKSRDGQGRHVFLIRAEKWDPKVVSFDDFLSSLFLLLDEALFSVDTQLHGITLIGDMKGLSLNHIRLVSPGRLMNVASVLQDSYPARFKEIHAFNNPYIFNIVWTLGKPLLKEKIRNRIHFHGGDISSLHRSLCLDASLLPEFLGGSVKEEEYADLNIINNLLQRDDYFKDFFNYGYSKK